MSLLIRNARVLQTTPAGEVRPACPYDDLPFT